MVVSAGGAIPGIAEKDAAVGTAAKDAFSDGTRYSAFAAAGFLALGLIATLRLGSGRAGADRETGDEAGDESDSDPAAGGGRW